ncbi:hypothetical protein BDZ94DRAFT_801818 [Collybia nuda]|uniref:Uncharacterized protein n=1 Tax=Collybia nuda TaxID=64659 RepID=A0A9P5XR32_9AGAR|nr:hypothetical protein BDZ94DRAFT_801818 [Collybia nuda]
MPKVKISRRRTAALRCEAIKRGDLFPLTVNLTPQDISTISDPTYIDDPEDSASSDGEDDLPLTSPINEVALGTNAKTIN